MKTNETKKLSIAFGLIVLSTALVILALSTLTGQAQVDDGYPAPIDYGYPVDVGYPIQEPCFDEYGYPIRANCLIQDPYFDEYGNPINEGYPIIPSYPDPIGYPAVEVVSEPTFADEWQAEMQEVREVIENVQPIETTPIYKTWQQLKVIVKYYYGQMIMMMK